MGNRNCIILVIVSTFPAKYQKFQNWLVPTYSISCVQADMFNQKFQALLTAVVADYCEFQIVFLCTEVQNGQFRFIDLSSYKPCVWCWWLMFDIYWGEQGIRGRIFVTRWTVGSWPIWNINCVPITLNVWGKSHCPAFTDKRFEWWLPFKAPKKIFEKRRSNRSNPPMDLLCVCDYLWIFHCFDMI